MFASIDAALPPASRISSQVTPALSAFMSATITLAPSRAKASAVARPVPAPPPITNATCCCISRIHMPLEHPVAFLHVTLAHGDLSLALVGRHGWGVVGQMRAYVAKRNLACAQARP